MNYIELFINEPSTANLDMTQEIDVALQYSIADIKDISKRNAAYSKTIILPGTKKNNYWFGNLFDVNADFTMFNPNKKTSAKLLVNTEVVMDGFLQLRKITKLNNVDSQGNQINYEVVIYNNSVDLMQELGEKTINLLDMSEFGHTFSAANIKASWTNTWQDGYVYPMFGLQTTPNLYKPEYFYPAIYYRAILDQMVREAGFGWTGSLLNNEQFNNEIISYVTDGRPKITDSEIDARSFYVGLSSSQNISYRLGTFPSYFGTNYVIPFGITGSSPAGNFLTTTGFTFSFGIESGLSPQGDGNFFDGAENNWNQSLYYWDVKRTGKFGVSYNLSYYFQVRNMTVGYPLTISAGATVSVRLEHILQYKMNNSSPWVNWDATNYQADFTNTTIAVNGTASKHIVVSRQVQSQIDLPQGAKVRLIWKGMKINSAHWVAPSAIPAFTDAYITHTSINGGNWIRNQVSATELQQNDYIELARYLPDKIKQKDLLTDLIRRYNLYIQVNPENPKQLIFDARPDFYERGETVDWTDKKDYSSPDEIELLSDLQSKLMIWSYKSDSDEYNKSYTEVTGDVYGQYKYYFDNDFVKGEERIESQFSPTPLVKTPFSAIVPGIDPQKPKVQPRVFYYGGLKDCNGWIWTYIDPVTGATGPTDSFTQYPYAGHFDDPINPEIDINFGTNKYYYYNDWAYITDNNMFNTYWSDYVRQIETGRLITSYFYLDEYDIRYIKDNFYTKIFVLDSYYYVNKIVDYKPLQNGVTKVELIKIVDGVAWEPRKTTSTVSTKPILANTFDNIVIAGNGNNTGGGGVVIGSGNVGGGISVKGNRLSSFKYALVGDDNVSSGDAQLLVGSNNTVVGDKSSVIGGDNNSILNSNSFIASGDGNSITADGVGVIIGGSGNTISSTNSTVLISTNNVTATQSGKVYIGDAYVVDTTTGTVTVGTSSTPWSPPSYYIEDTTIPAAKIQIINDNNVTLTSLVRGASGSEYIKHDVLDGLTGAGSSVFIQSSSLALESDDGSSNSSRLLSMPTYMSSVIYDNPTLTAVSTVILENISSDGQLTLDTIASVANTRQDTINLFPGGGSYIKSYETTGGDESRIDFYPTGIDTTISASGVLSTSYMSDTSIQLTITNGTNTSTQTLALSDIVSTATDGTNVATNVLQNDGRITLSSTDGGAISTVFDMLPTGVVSITSTDGTTFNNNISLNNLLTPGIQLTSDNAGAGNSASFALSEDEIMLKLINGVFTTSIIQSTASVTINTGITASKFDNNTTAGETGFMLWDISANTLKRVSIGAANSGGAGFKVLRVPN